MPELLDLTDYEAVRRALDTSLDSNALTDDIIELPPYKAKAEAKVLARDPSAAPARATRSSISAGR